MTRNWRTEGKIVRIAWTKPEAYGFARRGWRRRGSGLLLLLGPVGLGLVCAAAWQWWPSQAAPAGPASVVEWKSVQEVPKRAPDPRDVEWERRAQQEPGVDGGPQSESQSSSPQAASEETRLPSDFPARNDIYVIDGDTFSYGGERVRILGMDAPETHPPRCLREAQLGLAATAKLEELLSSGSVTISGSGRDRYGRELRQVFVNGVDVAQTMIAAGLASSYSGGKRQGWC